MKNIDYILNLWDKYILEIPHTSLYYLRSEGPYTITFIEINNIAEKYKDYFEENFKIRFDNSENNLQREIDFFKFSLDGIPDVSIPKVELIHKGEIHLSKHNTSFLKEGRLGPVDIPIPAFILFDFKKHKDQFLIHDFEIHPDIMAALPYLIGRAKYAKMIFSQYTKESEKIEPKLLLFKPKPITIIQYTALAKHYNLYSNDDNLTYEMRAENLRKQIGKHRIFDKLVLKQKTVSLTKLQRYMKKFIGDRKTWKEINQSFKDEIDELIEIIENDSKSD